MHLVASTQNSAVKAARKLAARRGRERAGAFLVEGPQAVGEALGCLRDLFMTDASMHRHPELAARAAGHGVNVIRVTEDVLSSISSTVTPQGVVGVAEVSPPHLTSILAAATLLVVGTRVADPGNVGALVRVADAGGVDAVVLTAGSVDPWNPKAVRASAGSLFHLPVLSGPNVDDVLLACRQHQLHLVAADAHAQDVYTDMDLRAPTALVFGSEAHGLSSDVLSACDAVVRVPIHPREGRAAESLNLATTVAVLVYEAARQRAHPGREEVLLVSSAGNDP